jgi:glycosyltransferase involved in cell wall biosynthesis
MHPNPKPLRIAMLVQGLPPMPAGGAEMQALKLGRQLTARGHQVFFFMPGKASCHGRDQIDGMVVYRLYNMGLRLFEMLARKNKQQKPAAVKIEYDDTAEVTNKITRKAGWPTWVYYNIFFWSSLLLLWPRRKEVDVIHTHTMEWPAIVVVRLGKWLRKPVLIKESTMNGFETLARYKKGKLHQQSIIDNAQLVAMTSVIHNNLVQEGIPESHIVDIPNGIELPAAAPVRQPAAVPTVLFVGNLYQQPAKGIDILLKAWVIVIREFPSARLQIVGDGATPEYDTYVQSLGIQASVSFEGRQSALSRYYEAAHCFVLPSRREGMSNALMEAMLHGVPAVATRISGSADLIQDGISGLLVPSAEVQPLAQAILHMLQYPEQAGEMGRQGALSVAKQCSMDVVSSQYESLYHQLTGHHS